MKLSTLAIAALAATALAGGSVLAQTDTGAAAASPPPPGPAATMQPIANPADTGKSMGSGGMHRHMHHHMHVHHHMHHHMMAKSSKAAPAPDTAPATPK